MNLSPRNRIIILFLPLFFFGGFVCRADVLYGNVEKKDLSKVNSNNLDAPRVMSNELKNQTKNSFPNYRNSNNTNRQSPTLYPESGIPNNSFPQSFLGRWNCQTEVINSAVKTVAVGTKMVSVVKFELKQDGRIVADWLQPGWTESQSFAVAWSKKEARVDRTCYYYADGMQGAWASRSRDHFILKNPTKMICKSYIDQYIDGRYLGRYRTVSVLERTGK